MLKNKILGKKIRNIIILIMTIIVIIGIYKYINNSKAENLIEIDVIAIDNYKYLSNEEFKLQARQIENELYEVEIPENIYNKKVNKIEVENVTDDDAQKLEKLLKKLEENKQQENIQNTEQNTENVQENQVEKIYLTKDQIERGKISLKVTYDVAILEKNKDGEYNKTLLSEKTVEEISEVKITEETKILHNKILKYEDVEHGKLVEVKGFLPADAELQVEEVPQDKLTKILKDKNIKIAYDIKIVKNVITEVPADEANPDAEPTQIVETIEINPEDFGEICEVLIKDANIAGKSKVYHVKDDNTFEQVNIKENTDGNVSFEAKSFSVYAVGDDVVDPDPGTGTGSHSYQTRINYTTSAGKSGSCAAQDYQWPEIRVPYGGNVRIVNNTHNSSAMCICPGGGNCQDWHTSSATLGPGYYGIYGYSGSGHTQGIYNLYLTIKEVTPPNATVTPSSSSWRNSKMDISISITSEVGLASGNSYQYYVSESESYLTGGNWTNYSNGGSFSINPPTGQYYVFVKRVKDTDGAPSTSNGSTTNVSGIDCHRFGPYRYDKIEPSISVNIQSCSWRNSALGVVISANDTGGSGISSNSAFQYYLSSNPTQLAGSTWMNYTSGSTTYLNPGRSGTYYLFVRRVLDNAGNTSIGNGTAINIGGVIYERFGAYQFDYDKPTIAINTTSCTWRNSTLNLTITAGDIGGSGLSPSNSYQYYLSNSSTALSGGTWKTYTNNLAFSIKPEKSGIYYLFVKKINDNAGNASSTYGTETTIGGIAYQRFGEYRFDYDAPVWSTQNLVIDKANDRLTVDVVGTDNLSGIATSFLTSEHIKANFDGIPANSVSVTLGNATNISGGIKHQLTLSNLEEILRQYGKEYKEWSGSLTIKISANTLMDNAGNKNIEQYPTLGHVDTVNPDFRYIYSKTDIDKANKKLTVVFSTADKFFKDSTLTANDLTILFDGKEPKWRASGEKTGVTREFTKIKDIYAEVNGTKKIVGKEYTLVLSNIEQSEIEEKDNYLNYSGIVTVAIPANKISDTSDNMNFDQTITVGVDFNEQYKPDIPTGSDEKPTYIPEGYTHVDGTTMDNGYVIQDSKGNQFVWVEVPKTVEVYKTAGLNIELFTEEDYNQIYKDLETYTSGVRKYLVEDNYKTNSGEQTGLTQVQYNTQKKKMLKSIYKNGGFYVGRYETGTETPRNTSGETTQTPVIKKDVYPYNVLTVAQAQKLSSGFASNLEGYTSSLMFGLQWNLILKHMNNKGVTVDELRNDSTSWGNYKASTFEISNTNAKYYNLGWKNVTGTISKSASTELFLTTGASETFCKQNIYDLAGNYAEWSLEYGTDTNPPVARGGDYHNERSVVANTGIYQLNTVGNNIGFRVSLYKDEGIGSEIVLKEPYIPNGYTHVLGTSVENGYVVQDEKGNQYVWVEVPRILQTYTTTGVNVTKFTDADYINIEEDLKKYVSGYRNGTAFKDIYSGSKDTTGLTESQYNIQKKKMLKSIYVNEGFYIGRYETGIDYSEGARTQIGNTTHKPVIKQNAYPYNYVTTSQAQTLSTTFTSQLEGYTSSLIFGMQWDLTMKYLAGKGITQDELKVNSTELGNYSNTAMELKENAKYTINSGVTWLSAPYQKTAETKAIVSTGANPKFGQQNIYDLGGNVYEWTMEYTNNASSPCANRGGNYAWPGGSYPMNSRGYGTATQANYMSGFRTTLYKDEGIGANPADPDANPDLESDKQYAKPSELFDKEGTDPNKLHIGDFVNYDAGIWTQEEIDAIKTGEKSNLVTANGSAELPTQSYQFGGFTAGSSRNGNATPYSSRYNYVKDKATGEAITGWRIFDIEGDTVTLISAGNSEDYYHQYVSGSDEAYVSEYILTGNVNSSWANGATESVKYQKRDWSKYVNTAQKAQGATPITKSRLDNWYTKYTNTPNANILIQSTFQKIYQEPYTKYQSMVENYSDYWLSAAYTSELVCGVYPSGRYVGGSYGYDGIGVRILVSLSSDLKLKTQKIGTKTVTGGNMTQYGGDQTYNVWEIKEEKTEEQIPSTEPVIVDVVDPKIEEVKTEVNIINSENMQSVEAQIVFRATDKYFGTSLLTAENIENAIKVIIDGEEKTEGITKILNTSNLLTEERQVNGENTEVQYGEEYTITIKGLPQNANQVKIRIPKGIFVDKYDNDSEETEFVLYNVLKPTDTEKEETSAFLGESVETTLYPTNTTNLTTIQRKDIEKVEFVNNIPSAETQGIQRVWDVSARNDRTILAWTFNTTAPYTIYIGSENHIFANQNASYLFSYIGYSQGREVIKNINLLNTDLSLNMEGMFAYCGYAEMPTLDLGDNFKTNGVTNMEGMFANTGYMAMTTLKLRDKFDTKNVTNMKNMFLNCGYTAMTSLDLEDKFDTKNVKDMISMFENCGHTAMKFLDLGPLFIRIAYENKNFMINCGKEDILIYAPESIYMDIKTFKINKAVQ